MNSAYIATFRWNDICHTFAYRQVMKNVDLNTVRDLLGCVLNQKTLRSAHLSPERVAAALAQFCEDIDATGKNPPMGAGLAK
jgi:hypothetical protein